PIFYGRVPRRAPRSTLSPYTTLFRSRGEPGALAGPSGQAPATAIQGGPCGPPPGDALRRRASVHGAAGRAGCRLTAGAAVHHSQDRKSTRLNSSHVKISYAVFCL